MGQKYSGHIAEKLGKNLHQMEQKEFRSRIEKLSKEIKEGLSKTAGGRLLKDYSPWLNGFQANQYSQSIEIPGQSNTLSVFLFFYS